MEVLIDKSYKKYNGVSRYQNVPYYYNTEDNKYVYGTTTHLRDNTAYTIHIVQQNDTLDTLALAYYNNPTYYWVIADFNRICDPFEKLEVGKRVKIPSFSAIEFQQ